MVLDAVVDLDLIITARWIAWEAFDCMLQVKTPATARAIGLNDNLQLDCTTADHFRQAICSFQASQHL